MKKTKLGERFFESTRGRIVDLLRGGASTVNELVESLGLTDNAVRAHLLALERDGLVKQAGMQRGFRKPHFAYQLTPEAEHLFPKAYDTLLNQLIGVLKDRFTPAVLEGVLREVGRSLAVEETTKGRASIESRGKKALQALAALGGAARLEKEDDKLVIRSDNCPLATSVSEHPEVCKLAEALVGEIMQVPVREHCDRKGSPHCRFEVNKAV